MPTLHSGPTAALDDGTRRALRAMLDAAFPGDFSDDDWAHALGGLHVWLADGPVIVAHASLVERDVWCGDTRLRVGFVEAVATEAAYRRAGHGTTVMRRIDEAILARHPLGVLSTGAYAFYETLGWERWRGPTAVDTPQGRVRTPGDDGDVMILRTPSTPPLDLDAEIVCDWRPGDVW